jgi:hypothetical protein
MLHPPYDSRTGQYVYVYLVLVPGTLTVVLYHTVVPYSHTGTGRGPWHGYQVPVQRSCTTVKSIYQKGSRSKYQVGYW